MLLHSTAASVADKCSKHAVFGQMGTQQLNFADASSVLYDLASYVNTFLLKNGVV